jgi:fructose-bisphosphate aldolase class II
MPVADYQTYCRMLERARAEQFAYPAINVTSLAEQAMAECVKRVTTELRSAGTTRLKA